MVVKFTLDSNNCTASILMLIVVFCRGRWENLEREDMKENLVLRFSCGYTSYSVFM